MHKAIPKKINNKRRFDNWIIFNGSVGICGFTWSIFDVELVEE